MLRSPALAVFAALTLCPAKADADAALDWSKSFYGRGPFCGTARVIDVHRAGADIAVRLHIDPRWSEALVELPANRRNRWFALHCPFVTDKIWSLPGARDVLIVGEAPFLNAFRFACRGYVFAD